MAPTLLQSVGIRTADAGTCGCRRVGRLIQSTAQPETDERPVMKSLHMPFCAVLLVVGVVLVGSGVGAVAFLPFVACMVMMGGMMWFMMRPRGR